MWRLPKDFHPLLYSNTRNAGKRIYSTYRSFLPNLNSTTTCPFNKSYIYKRNFSTAASKAVTTTVNQPFGELVDEPDDINRPELYAVPLTPPNLSISGRDIGIKPMSLEDFRKKISSFQNSDKWKEFKTDEGVIENERADILADRIHDLLSTRKQKFIYEEMQRFVMLPSPVDNHALNNMLLTIDKKLGDVSPALLPWIESFFNGTEFPEPGDDLKEVQMQLNLLTQVTEKFFLDWEFHQPKSLIYRNVHYDGFQWRVNVLRDCLEAYLSDEESSKLYASFESLVSTKKKVTLSQFLNRVGNILKFNEHGSDLISLLEWVIKGLNDFPLISITAIQSTEARKRDAERHTLICAYNKFRYHSKILVKSDEEHEKGALLLSFRLSTVLDDTQHKLFLQKLKEYQASKMSENDLQIFVKEASSICGQSSYLIEPLLQKYADRLTIPTLEHVRKMKKPVLTVKAVARYCSPNADVEKMLAEDAEKGRMKPLRKKQGVLQFQNASIPHTVTNANSLYQVFVHNLPVGIGTEELARAFRNCGSVSKVEILDYSTPEVQKKNIPKIRQTVSESRIYGFIHFTDKEARERALIPAMRVFGVKIRDCLCRTEPAENKRTLFIGNIDKGITGEEVSESLNKLLNPELQIELQDVASPGVLTTSAGYCFIEFDSHQLASMSFSLLSGAVVNGKPLKVGWALDSNDVRRRKKEYRWDKYHF